MVMNLGRNRLDGFKIGRRQWVIPEMLPHGLARIRAAVLHGLAMGHLLSELRAAKDQVSRSSGFKT